MQRTHKARQNPSIRKWDMGPVTSYGCSNQTTQQSNDNWHRPVFSLYHMALCCIEEGITITVWVHWGTSIRLNWGEPNYGPSAGKSGEGGLPCSNRESPGHHLKKKLHDESLRNMIHVFSVKKKFKVVFLGKAGNAFLLWAVREVRPAQIENYQAMSTNCIMNHWET